MKRYMLDTNMVSHLIKGNAHTIRQVIALQMKSLCISVITEAEMLFSLAKHPTATRLHIAVREMLRRIDVLTWDSIVAERYGLIRANMEQKGIILAPLDLLIATHALSVGAILVTNDKAFSQVANLIVEDWTV